MRTLLVTLTMCLLALPVNAKYSGGRGVPDDPYQIATAADLIALGETPEDYDKHFILTADIDLDPNLPGRRVFGKAVIAPGADDLAGHFQGTQFTGVFDGNGHTISRLTIRGEQYVGLFGSASAEISNLGLVDPHVTAEDGNNVGALVAEGGCYVFNCYVEGGRVTGKDGIGGLIGFARNSLVANCCARVSVSGHKWVGGLAGRAYDTYIAYSYVAGDVMGDEDVGGLAGRVPESGNSLETIEDSYSLATVSGNVKTGGFAGSNYGRVINCYSVGCVTGNGEIGGFIGYNKGKITACFWDVETSGCVTSAAGISTTTAEMKDTSTFAGAGWDFQDETDGPSNTWASPEGGGYPVLWWQVPESQLPPLPRFSGGTGLPDDPFILSTSGDLNHIGHNARLMAAHFVLANDIDLAGVDFRIIGNEAIPFAGVFDGNSRRVLNLTYRSTARACIGFFGRVKGLGAMVKDLCLVDPNVDAGPGWSVGSLVGDNWMATIMDCSVDGGRVRSSDWGVGGLAGYSDGSISGSRATCRVSGKGAVGGLLGGNGGSITTSSSSGAVSGTSNSVGGLVGSNGGSITISSSSSSVRGSPMSSFIGGLVGCNHGSISSSHSGGSVSGTANDVGGLVGGNYGSIATSYSAGWVMGKETVGGLVGYNDWDASIATSYSSGLVSSSSSSSYVGGLVGYSGGSTSSSFWDIQTSGQTMSDGGMGLATAEMQKAKTFLDAGWDFVGETANGTEDIWWINEGKDYPRLSWQGSVGMVFKDIPTGMFEMGDHDIAGYRNDQKPVHTVTLDGFQMSKYETTNAQYAEYLNAAMADGLIQVDNGVVYASSDTNLAVPYCDTYTASPLGHTYSQIEYDRACFTVRSRDGMTMSDHPVTIVSWYGAAAFCDYYGYRLPTEAEWEYAARGGYHDPYYRYPWGSDDIDCSKANCKTDEGFCNPLGLTSWPYTAPVGYYGPQGAYGLCDMSGNLWEWCQDWYDAGYYAVSPTSNPAGPETGTMRVLRGGAWDVHGDSSYVADRCVGDPLIRAQVSGFRACR